MATPETFGGFSADQNTSIGGLGRTLGLLGPALVLAGLARLGLGVVEVVTTSWGGLLALPEGALLALAGLALIAGSADAKYLATVKGREKEHLGNTYGSANVAAGALLGLGVYVALVQFLRLWI